MACDMYRKRGVSNSIVRDYVLPDYTHIKRGHVRVSGETSTGNEQVANYYTPLFTKIGRTFEIQKCEKLNQATRYASQHIWCLSKARINWEGCARRVHIWRKNGGDGRDGAPISLDRVAAPLDCLCVCLCYLHFAPENTEDGEMYLLVPAHLGCPGQVQRAVKWLCVCLCVKN